MAKCCKICSYRARVPLAYKSLPKSSAVGPNCPVGATAASGMTVSTVASGIGCREDELVAAAVNAMSGSATTSTTGVPITFPTSFSSVPAALRFWPQWTTA
jgi:hypothetical protein